jgi:hypothetical protein
MDVDLGGRNWGVNFGCWRLIDGLTRNMEVNPAMNVDPIDLAAAAVLACGADATLRRTSAAALWGWIKHWPPEPEVAVATCRRPHGIRTIRTTTLTRADIRTHHGIPTVRITWDRVHGRSTKQEAQRLHRILKAR